MRLLVPLACLAALAACSSDEPERPSETDEARFHEIDGMLDEERDAETQPESNAPQATDD